MILVYIAGPYRGPDQWAIHEHIMAAAAFARLACLAGAAVILPHLDGALFGDSCSEDYWLASGLEKLRRSDVIVLVPGWRRSAGSIAEHALAVDLGIEVIDAETTDASVIDRRLRWLVAEGLRRGERPS